MTVEEIEIIVTAKVEEALKEFEKMLPAIKKAMEQAQEVFSKVDTKTMTKKLNQAVYFMKKKMQDLKKSSENSELAIKVNNKDAKKQISQIQKEIDSLQKKISERELKLNVTNGALDKIRNAKKQEVIQEMPDAGAKRINQRTQLKLYQDNNYVALEKQSDKLNNEIIRYNALLDSAKTKMQELGQQTAQASTTQNKLSSFFSAFKQKVEQVKPSISNMQKSFKGMPKITQNITNNIKGMGKGLKNGLGHVLKYVGVLFGLRSIYTTLSNCASSWLSSQNAQAQQLSANIDYMKYAMGSVFAPVIQYVTNLVYNLMKAVQSLVYAFSGVNIFAKATASSMKSASGSASKASKSLSGIHNEINNVSDNDSSGGSGSTNPSMDLSQMDTEMSSLSQKLYNFFKPLVDSWNTYGSGLIDQLKTTASQIGELISSVWGSFENIITNGTVYSILENILAIIGNIAEAFSNAWNNNGNGDAIIQNLANALNNVLDVIKKITESAVFQWILDVGVLAVEKLTEAVEWVTQKVDEFVGFLTGSEKDLDGWAVLLGSLAIAIGLVTTATTIYKAIKAKETAVLIANTAAWIAANLPIILITAAITAVIAIIILCVKHWDVIKTTMINVANTVKEKVVSAFNYMKDKISNIFNKIKTTIINIWNGIWSGIKGVINKILGGIESFVNGTIKGINKLLSGISKVANAVGSVIGLNPISLQISTISLPRLAKGGVLTEATAIVGGEYLGAKSNPEIVTPQNIMRDTFEDVLSNYSGNNNDRPIYLTVNVGDKKLGQILLDDLRDKKRRTGKDIEALVGG